MLTRTIPRTGEPLPVIGLGTWHNTWHAFGEGRAGSERRALAELLGLFFREGGRVVDSSPAHLGAEGALGGLLRDIDGMVSPFVASKLRVSGQREGQVQLAAVLDRLGRVDLMQIHNLLDAATHTRTLEGWKQAGRVRYVGITHYTSSAYREVERWLKGGNYDFLQINYSLDEPEAAERLLPLAREKGAAVIVNRPFGKGSMFRRTRGKPLPGWARELGIASWAQYFLKWIIAHPAVTCAIPGTSKPEHVKDNLGAAHGALPDSATRDRMAKYFDAL